MKTLRFIPMLVALLVALLVIAACAAPAAPGNTSVQAQPQSDVVLPWMATRYIGHSVVEGILVVLFALAILGGLYYMLGRMGINRKTFPLGMAALVLLIAAIGYGSFVSVEPGYVGVVLRQGQPITTVEAGAHWVTPYWDTVAVLPLRTFTYATMDDPVNQGTEDFKDYPVTFTSKDGVAVAITYTVQGHLESSQAIKVLTQYGTLAEAIKKTIKDPSRVEVRQQLQQTTAPDLLILIDQVDEQVATPVKEKMSSGGLTFEFFGFRKPCLGNKIQLPGTDKLVCDYEQQLNAREVARKQAETEEQLVQVKTQQAQQAIAEAEGAKQITILNAQGSAAATLAQQKADAEAKNYSTKQQADADLYRVQQEAEATKAKAAADAEAKLKLATAEAQGNDLLTKSISPTLVEYVRWLRWNGVLPTWMMGQDGNFLFSAPTPPQK